MTKRNRREIVFFLDESALSFADGVRSRGYSVLSYADVGLAVNKGVPDETVARYVRKAGGAIIVTKNPRDFKALAGRHAVEVDRGLCDLGCGIVQVPSEFVEFNPLRVERNMYLPNGERADWDDVWFFNWLVVIHRDGTVALRELGDCAHCRRLHDDCRYCASIRGAMRIA